MTYLLICISGQKVFESFMLAFSCRGDLPSIADIEVLERQCGAIPLRFCHVEYGRVSFFSFNEEELPILP